MNVRKPVDYSAMLAALDKLVVAVLPRMELHCEIVQLVSSRKKKGAAVAAVEYLSATHLDAVGFSPRNLRWMREFYRTYGSNLEMLTQAMTIGRIQNVVILETELTTQEQTWYIQAGGSGGRSWDCSGRSTLKHTWKTPSTLRAKHAILGKIRSCVRVLVKRVGLREPIPFSSAVISDKGAGGLAYLLGHRKLAEYGIRCKGIPDRQLACISCNPFDLLIGLDWANMRNMYRICGGDFDGKMHLLMDYTDRPGDVVNPRYTDDFDATWWDVLDECKGLLRWSRHDGLPSTEYAALDAGGRRTPPNRKSGQL